MSGGVDSSVAAARLVAAGHEVVGATLKLWGGSSDSGCCSVSDVEDARRVAHQLGIDHHVFSFTEEFERDVVDPFVAGYAQGLSPNPCIECNRKLKFDLLVARARRLGFDALATGHHARVRRANGRHYLVRGADPAKDQSYVLGYLTEDVLADLELPIGDTSKDVVREEARALGLRTANKPDSQDVCFIESSSGRAAFLGARIPLTPGRYVDKETGADLGPIEALELVTIGQRRRVPPGHAGERRFVADVNLAAGVATVAPLADVLAAVIKLDETSLTFAREPWAPGARVLVQVSAHGEPMAATLTNDGTWTVVLDEPARPVAAGQSAVLYDPADPDVVVGAAVVVR